MANVGHVEELDEEFRRDDVSDQEPKLEAILYKACINGLGIPIR